MAQENRIVEPSRSTSGNLLATSAKFVSPSRCSGRHLADRPGFSWPRSSRLRLFAVGLFAVGLFADSFFADSFFAAGFFAAKPPPHLAAGGSPQNQSHPTPCSRERRPQSAQAVESDAASRLLRIVLILTSAGFRFAAKNFAVADPGGFRGEPAAALSCGRQPAEPIAPNRQRSREAAAAITWSYPWNSSSNKYRNSNWMSCRSRNAMYSS